MRALSFEDRPLIKLGLAPFELTSRSLRCALILQLERPPTIRDMPRRVHVNFINQRRRLAHRLQGGVSVGDRRLSQRAVNRSHDRKRTAKMDIFRDDRCSKVEDAGYMRSPIERESVSDGHGRLTAYIRAYGEYMRRCL